MSDVNDLLDCTLDDLEDLPSFEPYPPGAHRVLAKWGSKDINGSPAVELSFKYLGLIELANTQDEAPKEGDTCNTMFMLNNEFGRGNLKRLSLPFREAMGVSTIRELVENADEEMECLIFTTIRPDKKDPDRFYLNVKEIQIV